MNIKLRRFMHALTTEQQLRFAKLAGTSVGHVRHLVTEKRHASSALAIAMEKAAGRMRVVGLPDLKRTDLSAACKGCEYARACQQERLD
jgi:hypothetical protein